MPAFRNLDVHVVDKDGDELQEWGVQHLHSQNKISTYIKSTTNMTFRVTVQPRLPFHSPDIPMACDIGSAMGDTRPLERVNNHCSRGKFCIRIFADRTEEEIDLGTANPLRNRGFQLWSSKRISQTSTCRLSSNQSYTARQCQRLRC